jgi:hypothetical protein
MIYAYWIVVAAVFGVCIFLAGMIVGVREAQKILERPSPIEWKLSEGVGGGNGAMLRRSSRASFRPAPSESFYDWDREAVFIRPPTGPDLLVLDLQERTRT